MLGVGFWYRGINNELYEMFTVYKKKHKIEK